MPVHQAEWHWHHHMPLPYPDVTLPHDWYLDPERIPVPAAPRTLLSEEQRADPHFTADSPNWARWFAFEHEEARRCGAHGVDHNLPPPVLVVRDEDQEA